MTVSEFPRAGARPEAAGGIPRLRALSPAGQGPFGSVLSPVTQLFFLAFVLASLALQSAPAASSGADFAQGVGNANGTVTVYFDATWDSRYVDIHYQVNGRSQQNVRMTKLGTHWSVVISKAKAGDMLAYYFTYEKSGPQYDSPVYTVTIPASGTKPPPTPVPTVTPSPTPVASPSPSPSSGFSQSVVNANGTVTVNFDATWNAKYVDIHYGLNGGSQMNLRMAKSGNRWSIVIAKARAGDPLSYWFTYEKNGPQYESPVYTTAVPAIDSTPPTPSPTASPTPPPTATPTPVPTVTPTPTPNAAPAIPTGLTAIANGTDQITVSWNPAPNALGYDLQMDGTTLSSAVSPVIHAPLAANTTHTYAVRAKNVAGVSPFSANVSATTQNLSGEIVSLFNGNMVLEPSTVIETSSALITRLGDRGRDRHARESEFKAYDHYLSWYWESRTVGIEIVDRVAKGGTTITINITSLWKLDTPDVRTFFRGVNTVAEYWSNQESTPIDDRHYTVTIGYNAKEKRPIRIGDRMEIEVSPFLVSPPNGSRTNYYGTAMLYVVGQGGTVPWEGVGALRDSFPLPQSAWMGGRTTLPYQYSDEPTQRFKQIATNMSPGNIQPFMLGRRLFQTDFGNGAHSEPNNPVFNEQIGKLGPRYSARSCLECHVNNGRTLPPAPGVSLKASVRVGSDAAGVAHPNLGHVLQTRSTSGAPEGDVAIANWTTIPGTFGDGSPFELRKPAYAFTPTGPQFHSVRFAPALVGAGLLEAIDEKTVSSQADPEDANGDGISGRVQTVKDPQSAQWRLGRFGWKAGQARLSHQIAAALNEDMGVTTSVVPSPDRGSAQDGSLAGMEMNDTDLDNLYRYVATLGVPARRNLNDPVALRGEAVFANLNCVKCHTPAMTTSAFHPMAELRSQPIQPYSDLLLHDMGAGLADNMGESKASGAEWRTPPLWGIGSTAETSGGEAYLHDGRARNLTEAILWHGGEAQAAREAFRQLPASDRAAVVRFLQSL